MGTGGRGLFGRDLPFYCLYVGYLGGMMAKLNSYDIENESCPECDFKGELTYNSYCAACHCGNCGIWVNLNGEILEKE